VAGPWMRCLLFLIAVVSSGWSLSPAFAAASKLSWDKTAGVPMPPPPSTTSSMGPLRVPPGNPRYFMDGSGKAVYLTGSHTWDNLQDWGGGTPNFNSNAYLALLQRNNHNLIRLWGGWTGSAGQRPGVTSTNPIPWNRSGPGLANDGQPRYDLTKDPSRLNQAYFDRLRSRILAARERGIYVDVLLFTPARYSEWTMSPFNPANNINGINGDSNGDGRALEVETLSDPAILAAQKAYVRKAIETVNDLDNVLYEICNECHSTAAQWQYSLINFIKQTEAGMPFQHPVGMSSDGGNPPADDTADLFNGPADWVAPGFNSNPYYASDPPPADGRKVIILDTDHIYGGPPADAQWIWKSFMRGHNPIVMEATQNPLPAHPGKSWNDPNDPALSPTRVAMGHTLTLAKRVNLARLIPDTGLCSTGYCLVDPGKEYLVYLPSRWRHSIPLIGKLFRNSVTVVLSDASATFNVEWFNPNSGETLPTGTITAGTSRTLTAPFGGAAVLYLAARKS
jgi:hypothetical protein